MLIISKVLGVDVKVSIAVMTINTRKEIQRHRNFSHEDCKIDSRQFAKTKNYQNTISPL